MIEQESARRGLGKDDCLVVLNQDLTSRLADLRTLLQDSNRFGEAIKLRLQSTDLAKFVTTMVDSEQACYVGERIRVAFEIAEDVPLVQLDRQRFKQAWLNLFKNAVEAMPSGGTITVRLYGSDAHVCLEIEDTGSGVPEGIDVFEPFITTKPQGTGLGLGIVREIVSAHKASFPTRARRKQERLLQSRCHWLPHADALPNKLKPRSGDATARSNPLLGS